MSGNDIVSAESPTTSAPMQQMTPAAPSPGNDQYLPATHQYFHHCKQQQQQQQQMAPPSTQRCVMHIPIQPQQQQQQQQYAPTKPQQYQPPYNAGNININSSNNNNMHNNNTPHHAASTILMPQQYDYNNSNNSSKIVGEFDEFYWKGASKQQQQQPAQQQLPSNCSNAINMGVGVGAGVGMAVGMGGSAGVNMSMGVNEVTSASGRTYITPADIPPPPPHPPNANGRKRLMGGSSSGSGGGGGGGGVGGGGGSMEARQRARCHCEHPIEFVQQSVVGQPHSQTLQQQQQHSTHAANHVQHAAQQQQLQQQQQQQSYRPLNYHCPHTDHNHLPAVAGAAASTLTPALANRVDQQHNYHSAAATTTPAAAASYYKSHHHTRLHDDGGLTLPLPPSSHMSSTSSMKTVAYGGTRHLKSMGGYSPMKIRRMRIILGVIFALVMLALLAVALTFIIKAGEDDNKPPSNDNNGINLDDVIYNMLVPHRFNGTWSKGSTILYKDNNSIVDYDVKTKRKRALMYDEHLYHSYEKSADGELLLLAKNLTRNYRHSSFAQYDIYNITSGQIQPLNIKGAQRTLMLAIWAPVGNGLIINFERNLYYKPSAYADEITLTNDENPLVLNGVPDWVYEEEVFSSSSATWFNPNGTQIAFMRFDDSPTVVIPLAYYGDGDTARFQYPLTRAIAYPKAGSSNPRVSLYTADLVRAANGLEFITAIPVPSTLNTETDNIITAVEWLDNDRVLSVWMNRIQNLAFLQTFDGLKRSEIYNIESKTGWVNLFSAPFKNRDGSQIAFILPQLQDDQTYYRHLCTLSTKSANGKVEVLTKGKYVVESILHWDGNNDIIFFLANTEHNPEVAQLYAIKASTGQTPQCLTCKLHMSGDVQQTYFEVDFSHENQMMVSSQGPGIPMITAHVWNVNNNQVTLTKLMDWELNNELRAKLHQKSMPTLEIHTIPIADNFTAKVLLQLPPNMDRSGKTKYPLLVDVYGGPDSTSVLDRFMIDWGTYLSSNHSVIYAKIDGRGSGSRGDKLLHSVYLKLGTVEVIDQVEVTRQLQEKFAFIDANHTGIWGWSYGGYAAAMALTYDDSHVFRCAASVAPVTDWAYYDSIYTERYMSLPKLNEVGYLNSRLTSRANRLRGKKFLLIHGTLDDNVHYQQALVLAKNLERLDILFKQISYTDEDHSLSLVRPHLYHSLDRFFGDCFGIKRMIGKQSK